jgi:hypothetical protein
MQAQAQTIKMIASFNRGIYVPLIGRNEQPANVHNFLKEKGARLSLDHIKAMMEGREQTFKDFELLEVSGHHGGVQQVEPEAPRRGVPGRLAQAQNTPQKADLRSTAPAVARGRGREYPPSGDDIKPLKRGTVYANLMEMLLKGATMKEMLESTTNATAGGVNDVLSWQVKHRGYGLRFDQETGKYHLVLPKGHKGLTYQG